MANLTWKIEPYFSFETQFGDPWIDWMYRAWYSTFIWAAGYVMLVHPARKWMESRQALKLRGPLIAWNLFLGVFSIIGAVRTVPVMIKAIKYDGFYSTMCHTKYYTKDFVGIWGFLFVLSKVPELGDTLFIILRKQKMIFLHWYHHASALIFAWRMYSTRSSIAFWFCMMNYVVHSLMYSYYAIRAAGYRIHRTIAMCITVLQLSQMFMGMFAVLFALYHQTYGQGCDTKTPELIFGIAIYTSYMLLFAHFFYNAYLNPSKVRKPRDTTVADDKSAMKEVNGNTQHRTIDGTASNTNGVRQRETVGGAKSD